MSKIRRSMLFIPGNNPGMIQSCDVFNADSVIIDLEDAVSISEKDAARELVKHALQTLELNNVEVIIRINPIDSIYFEDDIELICTLDIDGILLPKATKSSILTLEGILKERNLSFDIIALIESARGVEEAYKIVKKSEMCTGILLGGEDLCADYGCKRTITGEEIYYARGRVVNAAKAAKKMVIDTPFTDVNNIEGLKKDTTFAKQLGFDGKAIISPRHVEYVNEIFTPSEDEINYALRVMKAKEEAEEKGLGVFSLDGKMVDLPIIIRAEKILTNARMAGVNIEA